MASSPDVLVATPGRIAACIREGSLTVAGLQQGLETLVLDEVRILRCALSQVPISIWSQILRTSRHQLISVS